MAGFHTKTFLKHDDYMTPKYAWENITQYIPKNKIVYEAFYGDGKSGEYLRELGCKEVIHEMIDFFDDTTLPDYDILISNSPFSKSKEIMNRLFKLDKPFILILPSSKINTSYMRIFKNSNLQIIIPRKRIHFEKKINGETPDGWRNACNFDCFYYCYKINLPNDIIWLE
jgi:hypothetical protein|tara:strand:- start:1408 stop:1917 length:510 start_codon:yes stop_codon:yes gene_type:complete